MIQNIEIPYTYEITAEQERSMTVLFKSDGYQDLYIGVRKPFEDEILADVIHSYAPTSFWIFSQTTVTNVVIGTTGTYIPPSFIETLESVKENKKQALSAWRYAKENLFVTFDGNKISTSRESRVAITETFVNMNNNIINEVNWKTMNGIFVTYNKIQFSTLVNAVTNYVQNCFNEEKLYLEQINQATTIEEVKAIQFGQLPIVEL
jgi:hypothetical protein